MLCRSAVALVAIWLAGEAAASVTSPTDAVEYLKEVATELAAFAQRSSVSVDPVGSGNHHGRTIAVIRDQGPTTTTANEYYSPIDEMDPTPDHPVIPVLPGRLFPEPQEENRCPAPGCYPCWFPDWVLSSEMKACNERTRCNYLRHACNRSLALSIFAIAPISATGHELEALANVFMTRALAVSQSSDPWDVQAATILSVSRTLETSIASILHTMVPSSLHGAQEAVSTVPSWSMHENVAPCWWPAQRMTEEMIAGCRPTAACPNAQCPPSTDERNVALADLYVAMRSLSESAEDPISVLVLLNDLFNRMAVKRSTRLDDEEQLITAIGRDIGASMTGH